jgi:phage shock protein A
MQTLRLWTAALVARIDGMAARIENHEALAQSAIQDVRRASARARVELRRVRKDGDKLRTRLGEAREAEVAWRDRARRKAGEDEAAALECLRRGRESGRRASELARRLEEHERVEADLATDVGRIQERLSRLEEHRHVLSARQTRAEAFATIECDEVGAADVEGLFDRWDVKISEREISCGQDDAGDAFEHGFSREEEEEELRAELDELLRK